MKKLIILLLMLPTLMSETYAQNTIEIKHKYYTLEFDTVIKSPIISWYIQTTAHATSSTKIDRSTVASFHQDPLIPSKYQIASDKKYLNNGHYDKGHLSPYTAFGFDLQAAKESMYYTNTAPQYSFFNEHPWEELEQYILKKLAPTHDSIYVYTGCLYTDRLMKDVPVPDYYWKVIYYDRKGNNWTVQAWIAKNEVTADTDYTKYEIDINALRKEISMYYPELKLPF